MPKVSILMNCYNGQKYLQEAIDSIYAQTFKDWEIIFIDNCSTDNSAKIAQSYDNKLKYYKTKKNTKLGEARNFGLQYCASDYLAFLDTDDIYLPNKLEQQIKLMDGNQSLVLCYSGRFYIDKFGDGIGGNVPIATTGYVFAEQLKRYEVDMQSALIRNNIPIKFDEKLEFSPDYDLFMLICSQYQVGVIKEKLIKYRKLSNSLSMQKVHKWGEEAKYTLDKVFTKYPELVKKYPKERKRAYAKVGHYFARNLMNKKQASAARMALKEHKYVCFESFVLYVLAFSPIVWRLMHKNRR